MIKWHKYYVSDVSNSYQLYDGKDENETLLKNVQGQTWNTKFVEDQHETTPKIQDQKYIQAYFGNLNHLLLTFKCGVSVETKLSTPSSFLMEGHAIIVHSFRELIFLPRLCLEATSCSIPWGQKLMVFASLNLHTESPHSLSLKSW